MLVDDHEVVRMGMKSLLERQDSYQVVAEAGSEETAVTTALETKPDIILMDIRLGNGSGIEACGRIIQELPDTKVIMLTSFAEDELLFAAIRAGAVGYVLKQAGSKDLMRAINSAARGEGALDPSVTQSVLNEVRRSIAQQEESAFSDLTDQEKQVLMLISQGETNRSIAEKLYLSQGTVRNYVSSVLSKLHLSNRAEAAAYAIKHRLADYLSS